MKFKKKLLAGLAVVALLVGGLAGCGKQSADNSVKRIKDKGTLTIGTSADFAPFEFPVMRNGKKVIMGYDIMVARKIAQSMGVKLKVQNIEFPSLISELQNHKVDLVLAGMTKTKKRENAVDFSKPYYTESEKILVKKSDANKFNTKADTNGANLGAQQSSTQETLGKSETDAHIVTESLTTGLTTDLKAGKLDGVILATTVAEQYVKKYPNDYALAKYNMKVPNSLKYLNIAIPKNEPALKKQVNKEITHLQKTGQLDKMFKKAQQQQEKYGK